MKLQINGQSLRLRIDEDELRQLRSGRVLTSSTVLPGNVLFRFLLALCPNANATMAVDHDTWQIALPLDTVDEYVGRLPCREGLDFVFYVGAGVDMGLGFEVDVRDSVRRRGTAARRNALT